MVLLIDRAYFLANTCHWLCAGSCVGRGGSAQSQALPVPAFSATLTAMFNPLPAIALLPLALIWFGLGTPSLYCHCPFGAMGGGT